jgi:hypothetical protein
MVSLAVTISHVRLYVASFLGRTTLWLYHGFANRIAYRIAYRITDRDAYGAYLG